MPKNCGLKTLKLWKGDIDCKVKGGTSAVCVLERKEVNLPPHQQEPPSIRSFCERRRKCVKACVH